MERHEAQLNAIKLSSAQREGENGEHMDMEGKVHQCPNCGHEMPMEEVIARAGGIKLSGAQKSGEDGAHMDEEGEHEYR
jgi:predicted RNA-binding Zn-ribbon protein involved in translation (DUF1610 family)